MAGALVDVQRLVQVHLRAEDQEESIVHVLRLLMYADCCVTCLLHGPPMQQCGRPAMCASSPGWRTAARAHEQCKREGRRSGGTRQGVSRRDIWPKGQDGIPDLGLAREPVPPAPRSATMLNLCPHNRLGRRQPTHTRSSIHVRAVEEWCRRQQYSSEPEHCGGMRPAPARARPNALRMQPALHDKEVG